MNSRRPQPPPVPDSAALTIRLLAKGPGWSVEDVVCSRGPQDRRFEEQHDGFVIAVVTAGTFQYRRAGGNGEAMMTPGSLLLGNPGQCFECGHEHGVGDRCLSFHFAADYFGQIAADRDPTEVLSGFRSSKLTPVRTLSPIVADACAALAGSPDVAWEELGVRLAARALQIDREAQERENTPSPSAVARITESVRTIENNPSSELTLIRLARTAALSPFHYLRTFEAVTGTTPHQYMLRARLRRAAVRLKVDDAKVVDVAFETGFGDVSNFNRAFRNEFGVSPTRYRRRHR